jgi:FKBP-type peptidyl-prolyl cis-trans isomerase
MFIKRLNVFLPLLMLFSMASCYGPKNHEKDSGKIVPSMKESLLNANKQAVRAENEQIEEFVRRYNWQMTETGSGLRYNIYVIGNGEKATTGKIATLRYEVRLITGDIIYSSEKEGLKEFLIGRGGVESGLEEGILLLRVGDRAKFIIPSHLGFGLLGDQHKVPPKSTLIYDIELISLN